MSQYSPRARQLAQELRAKATRNIARQQAGGEVMSELEYDETIERLAGALLTEVLPNGTKVRLALALAAKVRYNLLLQDVTFCRVLRVPPETHDAYDDVDGDWAWG